MNDKIRSPGFDLGYITPEHVEFLSKFGTGKISVGQNYFLFTGMEQKSQKRENKNKASKQASKQTNKNNNDYIHLSNKNFYEHIFQG